MKVLRNATKKTNILFLMTDQHRWDAMGCLNPAVKTPNLDKLAAKGIIYNNAVCNAPMCVPSRYSMMTGLYPSQCGVRHNTQMCRDDKDMLSKTLAQRLDDLGYQTAGFGKAHWYVNVPEGEEPVDVNTTTRGFRNRAEKGSDNIMNIEKGASAMCQEEPEIWGKLKEECEDYRIGGENALGYIGRTSEVPPDSQPEGWLVEKALNFLDNEWDKEQSFFLYLSLDAPHAPLNVPKSYERLYDINDIKLPQIDIDINHLTDHYIQPKNIKEWKEWREDFSEEERKRTILRYYAYCSYADEMFGKVINKLEELGEMDNTLIIFVADHGEMLGERNRFSKYSFYESSIRVPMIISGVGIDEERQGTIDDRCAELVDVMPTLIEVGGSKKDSRLVGYNLLEKPKRMGSFAELHGSGYHDIEKPPAYMWRTKKWKLILYIEGVFEELDLKLDKVKGELYHIKDDPKEYNNLYYEQSYMNIREKMTRDLLMHLAISWSRFPRPYSYTTLK